MLLSRRLMIAQVAVARHGRKFARHRIVELVPFGIVGWNMQLTVVGAVVLVLGVGIAIFRRASLPPLLAISAPFVTTAALTVGDSSIPPFFILALLAGVILLVRIAGGFRPPKLVVVPVVVLWVAALVPTVLGPILFGGTPVLDPRAGIDGQIVDPTPLQFTQSMVAQVVYLSLGLAVVIYLAGDRSVSARTFIPAVLGANAVSVLFYAPGFNAWGTGIFRNYVSASYNPYESRHYGSFSEPSYLAAYAVMALVFCIFAFPRSNKGERVLLVIAGVLSALNLAGSASGTAIMTIAVLLLVSMVIVVVHSVRAGWVVRATNDVIKRWREGGRSRLAGASLASAALGCAVIAALVGAWLIGQMIAKAETLSFANRTTADRMAFESLWNTWFIGSGLGSSRPSSLLALVASNIGLTGLIAFVLLCILALRTGFQTRESVPIAASLAALLVAKTVAEPALSTPLMWMAIGLCFGVSLNSNRRARPDSSEGASSSGKVAA